MSFRKFTALLIFFVGGSALAEELGAPRLRCKASYGIAGPSGPADIPLRPFFPSSTIRGLVNGKVTDTEVFFDAVSLDSITKKINDRYPGYATMGKIEPLRVDFARGIGQDSEIDLSMEIDITSSGHDSCSLVKPNS